MARVNREIDPIHSGEILLEEFLKPLGMSPGTSWRSRCACQLTGSVRSSRASET